MLTHPKAFLENSELRGALTNFIDAQEEAEIIIKHFTRPNEKTEALVCSIMELRKEIQTYEFMQSDQYSDAVKREAFIQAGLPETLLDFIMSEEDIHQVITRQQQERTEALAKNFLTVLFGSESGAEALAADTVLAKHGLGVFCRDGLVERTPRAHMLSQLNSEKSRGAAQSLVDKGAITEPRIASFARALQNDDDERSWQDFLAVPSNNRLIEKLGRAGFFGSRRLSPVEIAGICPLRMFDLISSQQIEDALEARSPYRYFEEFVKENS